MVAKFTGLAYVKPGVAALQVILEQKRLGSGAPWQGNDRRARRSGASLSKPAAVVVFPKGRMR